MIDIRLLKTRTSVEVCTALERMTSKSLSFDGFEITDSLPYQKTALRKSKRVHHFVFPEALVQSPQHLSYPHHRVYDPQTIGRAERSVGTDERSECQMSHHFRTSTRVLGLCSQVCCTEPSLLIPSEETEITTLWISSHSSSLGPQEGEISRAENSGRKTAVLGSPPRSAVLPPLST